MKNNDSENVQYCYMNIEGPNINDIDVTPQLNLDAKVEAKRLENKFGKYGPGTDVLELRIQEILDNSSPRNFRRAMRLAELLANDFENVEQIGYANILRHLNYTLVYWQEDSYHVNLSKHTQKTYKQERKLAERERKIIEKEINNANGETSLKDKFLNFFGVAGIIIYYLFCLIIWVLPIIMIDVPFLLSILISAIMMFIPITTGIFYVWALICTIQGPQDIFAIIFYIVFALLFLPYFIKTLFDLITKILHK